ncbi:MAG: DUF2147 domain-containing protein [Paracoccaceae bacterium]
MKPMLATFAAALLAAAPALADPLEGLWRTAGDDDGNSGLIEVAPCGAALCGTLTRAFHADGSEFASPNIGRKIIWDTAPDGDGRYRGMIYSPDRDAEYRSKLVLDGDRLTVSGCRFGICREGGVWTRAAQ